jgi:hypothetical protein
MSQEKWNEWNGGKFMPVPADAVGDVRLRSGKEMLGVKASDVLWGRPKCPVAANDNFRNGGEIVAYRFAGEAA